MDRINYFEEEASRYSKRYENFTWNFYEKVYQRKRINILLSYLNFFNGSNILDAGCGSGDLLYEIRGMNKDVDLVGFDNSGNMIKIAKSKKISNTFLFTGSILNIDLQENFDIVFCIGVIPYVEEIEKALLELKKVIKTEGICYITYPYKNILVNFLRNNSLGLWMRKNILKMASFKVKYEIRDFIELCKESGFRIIEEKKLKFSEILFIMKIS